MERISTLWLEQFVSKIMYNYSKLKIWVLYHAFLHATLYITVAIVTFVFDGFRLYVVNRHHFKVNIYMCKCYMAAK